MADWPNVFEHQQFVLRSPDGTRIRRSFRDIVTGNDEPVLLDYPQEFFNVAALNLLSYLAQVAFEPEDADELVDRIRVPMTQEEFERGVGPLRELFLIDGPGPRFMQGREVPADSMGEPLEILMMIAPKGDRSFLCRSNPRWAVATDQAALLLFARNTFYEGTGGRGYQKGANGDVPIRTIITIPDPESGGSMHARRSLWVNVLTRETQVTGYEGDYAEPKAGYDDLFWVAPPTADIPIGGITLRSALGWMTARHWLHFEQIDDEQTCVVTGESIAGRVALRVSRESTGIGYGAKGDLEAGVRAERFFRHPNVPTRKRFNKKTGAYENEQPFFVDRNKGLINAIGSCFFGAAAKGEGRENVLAPVTAQMIRHRPLHAAVTESGEKPRLLVFGFHMLASQRNVHGGYEIDTYEYALPAVSDANRLQVMYLGEQIVRAVLEYGEQAAWLLQKAIHQAAGVGVRPKETTTGGIDLGKTEIRKASDYAYGRDALAEFWAEVTQHHRDLVGAIMGKAHSIDTLDETKETVIAEFQNRLQTAARRRFQPSFLTFGTLPRTMPLAHRARAILYHGLKENLTYKPEMTDASH